MHWRPSHQTLYAIGVICVICVTGLYQRLQARRRYQERRAFATDYRSRFIAHVDNSGQDISSYTWLIAASTRMQVEMGGFGIYSHFRGAGFQATNYSIIMNGIPALRDAFDRNQRRMGLYGDEVNGYIQMLNDTMVRYLGSLEHASAQLPSLWNPMICFREGVRAWLSSPLTLLNWFGVISAATASRLVGSKPFTALSGIAAVLGFIGTMFTIVLGWDDMHKLVSKLLPI
jgi:hypothetical protein